MSMLCDITKKLKLSFGFGRAPKQSRAVPCRRVGMPKLIWPNLHLEHNHDPASALLKMSEIGSRMSYRKSRQDRSTKDRYPGKLSHGLARSVPFNLCF